MSPRAPHLLLVGLMLLSVDAYSFNVYRLGGEDGNRWEVPLSYEPGEYLIFGAEGVETGRRAIAATSTHETWRDTLVERVDSLSGQWLRPFFVADTLNLAQSGVRDRYENGFLILGNLLTSGTSYDMGSETLLIVPMVDGDPTTAAFYGASASSDPLVRRNFYIQSNIVDLGVNYPVNRVRFFPRLGTDNPKIDEILEQMDPPKLRKEDLLEEDFSANFLPWFELGAASSDQNLGPFSGGWVRRITYGTVDPGSDPRFTILKKDTESQAVIMDHRFPTQQLRWITYRVLNPIRGYEIAEFQVFGDGFVERAVYTTAVLDFGEPMAWGKIRWEGEKDPLSQVVIRTRSGGDEDPRRYWQKSEIPGEFTEITRDDFRLLGDTQRRITLDERNWSFWSSPYSWEAGLTDTTRTAAAWEDGTPVLSPGPSRYLQLQILFLSTLDEAAKLRQLELQFARPTAEAVVGEVWPLDVSRTESTTFTYSVRPTFGREDQGFDRLEIFTLTRVDLVRSVRVDGEEVIDRFPPQIEADRILLPLPRLQGRGDTFKLIEVVFDVRVVRYGTEFQGWVFDSEAHGVKQLIDPGDATVDFPGNALGVRTRDLGERLLAEVSVFPNPFTPNGDGINDRARFQFQVHEVTAPRPLQLSIYDLSGRRVRQLDQQLAIRGVFGEAATDPSWDGLDDGGRRVAPGLYVYRIFLEADQADEETLGIISVVY